MPTLRCAALRCLGLCCLASCCAVLRCAFHNNAGEYLPSMHYNLCVRLGQCTVADALHTLIIWIDNNKGPLKQGTVQESLRCLSSEDPLMLSAELPATKERAFGEVAVVRRALVGVGEGCHAVAMCDRSVCSRWRVGVLAGVIGALGRCRPFRMHEVGHWRHACVGPASRRRPGCRLVDVAATDRPLL